MAEPTYTGGQSDDRPVDASIPPPPASATHDGDQPRGKSASTRVDDGDRTEVTLHDSDAPTEGAPTSVIEASEAIARELAGRQIPGEPFAPEHSTIVQIIQDVLKASSNPRLRVRPPPATRQVAGYEILSELGRGAVGVVYQARQVGLNRLVALKMILAGGHASRSTLARFRAEAAAVASLQHGNIVQIYEIGEHEGLPYFSLEYCAGGSLAERLKGAPIAPVTAAHIAVKLARAMHYAHGSNVVHRDLKPGNILLHPRDDAGRSTMQSRRDEPFDFDSVIYKITDFGLAKRLDEASHTKTGAVLGTPSYMAPEQASGKIHEIGPSADVYALGAMLYEFLTGRPPFRAASPLDTVVQVINDEPVAPTRLQSGVPVDLETIALKCLQKDPAKRYETAAALADDLQRFLDGKPILARPVGRVERAWRWCRRNPVVASLSALAVVLLVAGTAVSSFFAHQSRVRADLAEQNELAARRNLYVAQMNLVQRAWDDVEMARVRDLLASQSPNGPGQPDFRGPEWHYWDRLAHRELAVLPGHAGGATCVAISPDGQRIASGGRDHCVRIWSTATNAETAQLAGHSHEIAGLAFLSNDRLISAATILKAGDKGPFVDGGEIRIWDLANEKLLAAHPVPSDSEIKSLALSGNAELAAVACQDGSVHVMRTADGSLYRSLSGKGGAALAAALSPDGAILAAAFDDGTVALWTLANGERLPLPERLGLIPWSLAFAPEGQRLAVGGAPLDSGDREFRRQGEVRIIQVRSGRVLASASGHAGPVLHAEFSRDGNRLATASHDRTIGVWDALTALRQATFQGHEQLVNAATFSPDGRWIASAGLDGSIRIWESLVDDGTIGDLDSVRGPTALSPDGSLLAIGNSGMAGENPENRTAPISLFSTRTRQLQIRLNNDGAACASLLFAIDSRTVEAGCLRSRECRLRTWRIDSKVPLLDQPLPISEIKKAIGDQTGTRCLIAGGNQVLLVALDTGAVEAQRTAPAPVADLVLTGPKDWRAVCIDPEKRTAAVWESSHQSVALDSVAGLVKSAALNKDGRLVAIGCTDGTVRIIEAASGRITVPPMTGHLWTVAAVAFNDDGTRLASAGTGFDGTVRLWDTRTGQELLVREIGAAPEPELTFGPRDHCLLVQATKLSLWDLRPRSSSDQFDRAALAAARFHLNQPQDRPDHLSALRDDGSISADVRAAALQLAETWPDNPERFGQAAWEALRSPFGSPDSYQQGLAWAERYAKESPRSPARGVLVSLGRVRAGQPADAIGLLNKLEQEISGLWRTRARAILAIALERTGQHDKALQALQLLKGLGVNDELYAEASDEVRVREK